MNSTRRLIYLGFCLSCALALTGCWDRIEVNDLAIVQGIALDHAPDGHVEVTISIPVPSEITPPGATGGGAQLGPPATNKSAVGRTVTEAVIRLQEKLSRRIYWAHNAVILIGEDLARDGIGPVLDFFTRNRQSRLNSVIAVTTGKARDVLASTLPVELNVPTGIQEMERLHLAPFADVKTFLQMMLGEGIEPTTSLVHVVTGGAPQPGTLQLPSGQQSERDPAQPAVFGAAVFKGDRLVTMLSEREAAGILFAKGQFGPLFIPVSVDQDRWVGMRLLRYTSRYRPRLEGDQLRMEVHVSVEAELLENKAGVDADDPRVIKLLERELEKTIGATIRSTVTKMQDEAQADIFGFGAAVRRRLPTLWREISASWDEIFARLPVDIEVKAAILRTGLTNRPQPLTRGEVLSAERLAELLREE